MKISILPKYNKIIIDDVSVKCIYSVSDNIEFAFYDDVLERGKIAYNDGTENKLLTSMPNIVDLLTAYWVAYGVKFLPSSYHSWDSETHEFFITPENQALKDSDEAAAQAAQNIIDNENATNPLSNITFEQAETWIDNNVIDLATAKTALKKLARLIIIRR